MLLENMKVQHQDIAHRSLPANPTAVINPCQQAVNNKSVNK